MTRFALVLALVVAAGMNAPSRVMAQDKEAAAESAEHGHDHGMEELAPEDFPRQESMLMWTFNALGWRYTLALPLAGLVSFVLALVLVVRGGPYAGPALLFVVPVPLLVGAFGFFDGMIVSFNVMTMSHAAPKPSEVAYGISTSLVIPLIGMLLMAPAYLIATGGLLIRAVSGERERRS